MQIFGNVDLPLQLLEAQESGQLVIFVGAGASMPEPSGMPNFLQLATDLGKEALADVPQSGEPLDRYLGDLESKGFNVHQRAKARLNDRESYPNTTHESIVSLALSSKEPRIITTNFDLLLQRAWEEFDKPPQRWVGPALPLGDDFTGIVQIHGALDSEDNKIVLTDADFGQAYITRSWAARFLVDVFSAFTVLFVGYSHEDPIMSYLAQGLPRNTARFALLGAQNTENDRSSKELMERLGIFVIEYSSQDNHAELPLVLKEWARRSRLNKLGVRQETEEILRNLQNTTPGERDFLRRELGSDDGIRNFAAIASKLENNEQDNAYRWVRDFEVFKSLFDRTSSYSVENSTRNSFINWVTEYFVRDEDTVLEFWKCQVEFGTLLHEDFARLLLSKTESEREPRPSVRALVVYLRTCIPGISASLTGIRQRFLDFDWGHLTEAELSKIVEARVEANSMTFRLPELFSRHVRFEPLWDIEPEDLESGLEQLRESSTFSNGTIVRILESSVRQLNSLLCSLNSDDDYDVLTSLRPSIEIDESAYFELPFNVIINFLRDTATQGEIGQATLSEWRDSNVEILQKIAVFSIAKSGSMSKTEKLEWILARSDLVISYAHFPEMRLLIDEIVEGLETSDLVKLLDTIRNGYLSKPNEFNAFNCLRILQTLLEKPVPCGGALEIVQDIEEDFPNAVPESDEESHSLHEYRELDYEPIIYSEIQSGRPQFDILQDFFEGLKQNLIHAREILDAECMALVLNSSRVSLEVAVTAASLEQTNFSQRMISKLLGSIDGSILSRSSEMLQTMSSNLDGKEEITALARAILTASEADPDLSAISTLEQSIDSLWSKRIGDFDGQLRFDMRVSSYLNDWPGILVKALERLTIERWKLQKEVWSGLPEETRNRINMMLSAPAPANAIVAEAFAASLRFFVVADEEFAVETIVPLFYGADDISDGAWLGFLSNPFYAGDYPLSDVLLNLLPHGWNFVKQNSEMLCVARSFFRLMGTILKEGVYPEEVTVALLLASRTRLPDPLLVKFYEYLSGVLSGEQGLRIWRNGVRNFIETRIDGKPRSMSDAEHVAIARIPFRAVNLAVQVFEVVGDTSFLPVEEESFPFSLFDSDVEQQDVLGKAYIERIQNNGIRPDIARSWVNILQRRLNPEMHSDSLNDLEEVLKDLM